MLVLEASGASPGIQRGWCIRISATARAASLDDDDNDDDEEDRRRVRCSED